jgi:NAD+ dependent glucose-6-phosphate dehydrogenase
MTKTVLITGAQGNVGKKLRAHLLGRYELKLLDMKAAGDADVAVVDLSKWDDRLVDLFTGVDAVVHLAADPHESKSWLELIPPNLDALNNVFVAAIKAKVPRVIYASSNHAMGGYKDVEGSGRWLTSDLEPKPGTRFEWPLGVHRDSTPYGAMKLCGERLGLCYAESTPGVCIALRIGWVNPVGENRPEDLPAEANTWYKRMWLSNRDMCQLIELSITVPKPAGSYLLLNGMSDNEGMVWDIEYTRKVLGYVPQDGLTLDNKDRNRTAVN